MRLSAERRLPPAAVCITFDDGYRDNADVAMPILKRHGVAATFFVASAYVDGGMMWNDKVIEAVRVAPDCAALVRAVLDRAPAAPTKLECARSIIAHLKYLDTAEREARADAVLRSAGAATLSPLMMSRHQVAQLAVSGMEVGAHTVSHPILARTDDVAARIEIERSRAALEDIVQQEIASFAYPNGRPSRDFTWRDVELVRAAGFRQAVTTSWGVAGPACEQLQLPRAGIWRRGGWQLLGQLASIYFSGPGERVRPSQCATSS
ncbi:MAG TPA: polysaccharide deacetylase family protein [Steroidobacteraceae bacterium]|nr:polysaccharide deacetylase family protein [Steroidobacteraceae bacterium]